MLDRGLVEVRRNPMGGQAAFFSEAGLEARVINAVAQFERDLLIERKRARAAGIAIGRPASLDEDQRVAVRVALAAGESVSAIAKRYGTSRQTVMRARDGSGGGWIYA
jgi:putative DNA-invertase from lambdoid prophage Rac